MAKEPCENCKLLTERVKVLESQLEKLDFTKFCQQCGTPWPGHKIECTAGPLGYRL